MSRQQKSRRVESWVVYQSAGTGDAVGPNAVCEQAEWEAMEAAAPGRNRLIRAGIVTEGEAERLARGTSGDPVPRTGKPK
ncbi:hypothetical protein J0H58_25630 [bacterium]|nr:hypothetical protein [bacterium]